MRQNYFVYNGMQYNSGTVIVIRWFSCVSRSLCDTNATFLYFDTDENKYFVDIYGKTYEYTTKDFYNNFRRVYNKRNNTKQNIAPKEHTFIDELENDGLLIAWVWYIFIMMVAVIFYDRIGLWILTSIIFFNYRNKKLKEAGYK